MENYIGEVVANTMSCDNLMQDNREEYAAYLAKQAKFLGYETPVYEGYTKFPMVLGKDECFVLADARQNGTDSRYFGAVQKNEIVGTVITIVRRNNL